MIRIGAGNFAGFSFLTASSVTHLAVTLASAVRAGVADPDRPPQREQRREDDEAAQAVRIPVVAVP